MTLQKNPGPVRRFAKLTKFAAWLQNIPNKITPAPFRLMQIGSAFWQSRALYVAARLDIASVLADEQLTAEEIAARTSTQPDATYRLLRLLAAMSIFEEVSPRVFRNNKLSDCLCEGNPQNVRAMILMHNSPEMSRPWFEQLEQAVRSGDVPFKLTHGQELYDYQDDHPEFDSLFAKALVVDRAQIIQGAAQYWQGREEKAVLERMSFQTGDLFESVPQAQSSKDIYLLSAVLHGFDDDACIAALRNLAKGCGGAGATIVLMEMVMSDARADLARASFDMQMFMGTRGRERTLAEWQRLFERSGLKLQEVVGLQSFGKLLVLLPQF